MPKTWLSLLHFFFQKKKSVHKITCIELVCEHSHFKKYISPKYARNMAISFAFFFQQKKRVYTNQLPYS